MAKQKKAHRRLDPEDVLEGRARPDARELLALIHEVNPSGHDLPAKENARRYALKSRLQSLLVRRFPEHVEVEPGDEPGVVGLRHRSSGVDACHAVLASLDDDARSWVQFQLDTAGGEADREDLGPASSDDLAEPAPPSDAPLSQLSTEELLRRGRAALKAYDYDAARERFAAAHDRGNREGGLLLLTVLVEHLGLDEDALELAERLDDETLKQPAARLLVALAAARSYDRPRALRLAGADTGEAAGEVFVALARGALARGAIEHAEGDVGEAQRRTPFHPALADLAETVKKRRAEERAPLEAEAQRLFDEGRFDEAESKAAALAARWPEGTVAPRIARAGEERRRLAEARALALQGKEALQAGESGRALGLLRRALALGLGGGEAAAEADLERAEAEDYIRALRDEAVEVARTLNEGHLVRGLTAYLGLGPKEQEYVKEHVPLSELVYLDQAGVGGGRSDAKARVLAVMALKRALGVLGKEPATALDLLLPHIPYLEGVPHAEQCVRLASEHLQVQHQLEARQRFNAALAAFGGHNREALVRAIELFSQVRRADLDPEGQSLYDAMFARTKRMLERMDRAVEVGKLRTAGNLLAARDAFDALIRFEEAGREIDKPHGEDGFDSSSLATWLEQRAVVLRQIAKAADVRLAGAPASDCLLGLEAPPLLDVPQSVLPGGEEVVLAEAHRGRIFVQVLDAASGRVTRRATVFTRDVFEVGRVQQHAGSTVLTGSAGGFFEIDACTWEIGRAFAISAGNGPAQQSVLAPAGRFVWGSAGVDGWWTSLSMTDLERDRSKSYSESVRKLTVRPLLGLEEPRVVLVRDRGSISVLEARGAPVGPTLEGMAVLPRTVVAHPGGEGLFALMTEGERAAPRVRWAELAPNGTERDAPAGVDRTLEELDPFSPCETAVGLDERAVFVLGWARVAAFTPPVRQLVALAARGRRIERCFSVEVPGRVTLAQDGAARAVVALSPHEAGIEVVRLSTSPPVFRVEPPKSRPLDLASLTLVPLRACAPAGTMLWSVSGDVTGLETGVEYIQHVKGNDRKEMLEGVTGEDERAKIVPRYAELWKIENPSFAQDFAAAVAARHPGDPEMRQIPAHRAAVAGRFAELRDLLAPIDPATLGDAAAQHHDHLLGVALLMTGDPVEARRVLARGAARPGACELDTALALADFASPGPEAPSPTYSAVRALDRAVREADARLSAGDPGGARKTLSGLAVREAREVQSLGRLARAWLLTPDDPEEATDLFAKTLALAAFWAAHGEKKPTRRRELPFPGARWDAATLDALGDEAGQWLDALPKRPRAEDV